LNKQDEVSQQGIPSVGRTPSQDLTYYYLSYIVCLMSEFLKNIDPVGFRIEAGPNVSQNPELLSGVDGAPDDLSASTSELHRKFSSLAVVAALGLTLEARNHNPSEGRAE